MNAKVAGVDLKRRGMDLTDRATHFEFGQNWADYSKIIDQQRLGSAIESVSSLAGDLAGKSFLDIGSGSGLFSLAALKLGAAPVLAVDIDENSVATTKSVLATHEGEGNWRAELVSVFNLDPDVQGRFDVVYSWGVLHHTGSMWEAIQKASAMVKPGGLLVIALYEKTPMCGLWKKEKKLYMRASARTQKAIQNVYTMVHTMGIRVLGRKKVYARGMNGTHDLHDWLGGYPYESTSKKPVDRFLSSRGFTHVRDRPVKIRAFGILGSGCSEYVYRRESDTSAGT